MKVRWLPEAADDLQDISDYLIVRSAYATDLVVRTIYEGLMSLADFPYKGHPYGEAGTLRLLFPGLSYQATYRVKDGAVEILRISHTSLEPRQT